MKLLPVYVFDYIITCMINSIFALMRFYKMIIKSYIDTCLIVYLSIELQKKKKKIIKWHL